VLRGEVFFFGAAMRIVSRGQQFAAPHHTSRLASIAPRKKPKALLPWAESTNGGGGGDKRCGETWSTCSAAVNQRV
jgi:hypothetical protein